jgi:hypothetical protein
VFELGEKREVFGEGAATEGAGHTDQASLDRARPVARFLRLKRKIGSGFDSLEKALAAFIRETTRSPFLDPHPGRKANRKKRNSYLRGQTVLGPECGLPGASLDTHALLVHCSIAILS